MIEVCNLVKRYGDKTAVNNISFTVYDGEVTGFLGPNGAGKTTTMNILTGYLSSNEGTVKINGLDILEEPIKTKALIGYLPEQPPLYTDMTVKDYLMFVCRLKKFNKYREAHIEEVSKLVNISDVSGRLIKNLSKGYRQRVGLAQALIGKPEIIVLDEPTSGLDPKEKLEIGSLIQRLGKTHTVILSSHILAEIQSVCDRIIVINHGEIVANGKKEEIGENLSQKHAYSAVIEGPVDNISKGINALPGVTGVKKGERVEKGVYEYTIETDKTQDMRRGLFQFLSKNNYPLLALKSLELTLEEIFLKLITQSNEEMAAIAPKPQRRKKIKGSKAKLEKLNQEDEFFSDDDDDINISTDDAAEDISVTDNSQDNDNEKEGQ